MSDDRAQSGPFRRLGREVLIANPWHRYCRDRYLQRDGSEGVYYYVDMPGSSAVIPVFDDGTMVLLRARRYLLGLELWEFPIGGMREGDEPLAVAQHELRQEAGLTAGDWTPLGYFAPYKGVSNERCHFFLARALREVPQELEPSEAITVHRMPIAEARSTLLGQECGDGQSMAGLLLLDRWLAAGNTL
ncbi:MAG TPA: NUDIX hydrolase [bacterium]|nr:NUDIX hydrolase [bacterium]